MQDDSVTSVHSLYKIFDWVQTVSPHERVGGVRGRHYYTVDMMLSFEYM